MSLSEPIVRPVSLPELRQREASLSHPPAEAAAQAVREGHRIASAIIARAIEQAREIQAAAEEQGLELGTRRALDREGPALREAAATLAEAAARLDAIRQELGRQVEAALPELAVSVASRVLRRELSVRPETLVHVIREAIAAVAPAARITVRLHPEDMSTFERHRDLLADTLGGADFRIESAPDVGRGGCLVDTDALTLAAGLPQQLERALALLREPAP